MKLKDFFAGLSWVQVLAGAGAAVTSFLLSKQIGIAGSVIGAGVASVVSAVASQLYKNVLSSSADKVREKMGAEDEGASSQGEATLSDPAATRKGYVEQFAPVSVKDYAAKATATLVDPAWDELASPAASPYATRRRRQAYPVVIAVLSALAAVAVCALVIGILTSGNGLGYKPSGASAPSVGTQAPENDAAALDPATSEARDAADPTGADATQATPASDVVDEAQNGAGSEGDAQQSVAEDFGDDAETAPEDAAPGADANAGAGDEGDAQTQGAGSPAQDADDGQPGDDATADAAEEVVADVGTTTTPADTAA